MYDLLFTALFENALTVATITAMVIGLFGGVIAGAIPGLSATMAVALMLPLTYGLDPLVALAIMAGVHNGAAYGGSIPAVLLKIPGTPAAVATTFDGYPMAQSGMVKRALKISVVSSSVGGMLSAVALMTLAPPLADFALRFGPAEIFWVSIFGLVSISVLLGKNPLKGLLAASMGFMLGMVGIDIMTGYERFTMGILDIASGLPLVVVLIALFAVPAAWIMGEENKAGMTAETLSMKGNPDRMSEWPWRRIGPAWVRGGIIGTIVGLMPGLGGAVSSLVAYSEQKRSSANPDDYGKGEPAGLAAAECANNADNAASMIPALTLGVPGSGVAAIVLAGLLIHGMEPGPQLFSNNPDVVFGYMWSMFITALLLLFIGGTIAVRIFAQVLRLPQVMLMPMIVCLTVIGTYAFANSIFDVWTIFVLGFLGYAMDRLDFPVAPAVLALFLGPKVEFNMRVALRLSNGDWSIMWASTITQAIIAITVFVLFVPMIQSRLRQRRRAASTA